MWRTVVYHALKDKLHVIQSLKVDYMWQITVCQTRVFKGWIIWHTNRITWVED